MDRRDADGDGFVEYARASENGLANQGATKRTAN